MSFCAAFCFCNVYICLVRRALGGLFVMSFCAVFCCYYVYICLVRRALGGLSVMSFCAVFCCYYVYIYLVRRALGGLSVMSFCAVFCCYYVYIYLVRRALGGLFVTSFCAVFCYCVHKCLVRRVLKGLVVTSFAQFWFVRLMTDLTVVHSNIYVYCFVVVAVADVVVYVFFYYYLVFYFFFLDISRQRFLVYISASIAWGCFVDGQLDIYSSRLQGLRDVLNYTRVSNRWRSSFAADVLLIAFPTSHPIVVTVKEQVVCLASSPVKHRNEPLEVKHVRNIGGENL